MSKDQHNVGTPEKPRGQQMGFAGQGDQNREEMNSTPAVEGPRSQSNKMVADRLEQHVGSDLSTPSTNTPSTPAMKASTQSETGGATDFKKRLAKKRQER